MQESIAKFAPNKPKKCGACAYFNRVAPCKLDYYSTAQSTACSQGINRQDYFRGF